MNTTTPRRRCIDCLKLISYEGYAPSLCPQCLALCQPIEKEQFGIHTLDMKRWEKVLYG